MNIMTDSRKEKQFNNPEDRAKLQEEHRERLKEAGIDKLVGFKGQNFQKQFNDVKDNFHEFEDKMGVKQEYDNKVNKQKRLEKQAEKARHASDAYMKYKEEQERRAYEARKITLR
jgi:hypothetical protein